MQKSQAASSPHIRNIIDLKILQFDWLITLWPISQELDIS